MFFNLTLLLRLVPKTFSANRKSLRYPTGKRIGRLLVLFPLFALLLVVNHLFLLLDCVFFPHFLWVKIPKSVFIVGVPRTATTFLLDSLSSDREQFTSFRLWELVFAPSVIQKYFFRGLLFIDRYTGKPFRRLASFADKMVFGNFRAIHNMGFGKPEEDEALLLWCFSSAYLAYFFPETAAADELLFFDDALPLQKRKRIMRFYFRCVQRHQLVFNRHGKKYFLSKNPAFVCKMETVPFFFPEAKILYTLRTPFRTIPATISLNANIYSAFSTLTEKYPLQQETKTAVIRWYKMADVALRKMPESSWRIVPFLRISKQPENELENIYRFLGVPVNDSCKAAFMQIQQKADAYKSGHSYDTASGIDEQEIRTELDFVINGPYKNEIG